MQYGMLIELSGKKESAMGSEMLDQVTARYPATVASRHQTIRQWIFDIARQQDLGTVEASLKWGEPSYKVASGTAIRFAWKPERPDEYAICVHCSTRLIDTFREIYADTFRFSGNRALVFNIRDELPEQALKQCLALAMVYHRVKHLPLLGV